MAPEMLQTLKCEHTFTCSLSLLIETVNILDFSRHISNVDCSIEMLQHASLTQ